MRPIAPRPGLNREIALLFAGAIGTGLLVWSGLPGWIALALGGATLGFAVASLRSHPRLRPSDRTDNPDVQKPAESEIRLVPAHEASSGLHQAADASDDLILVFSSAGSVAAANIAANDFFGAGGIGVVGRSLEDLLPQAEFHEIYQAALSGQKREAQVAIAGRDSRRTFLATCSPLAAPGAHAPSPIVLRLRDISDFQPALRLGGDFVASISHELRTPLASIKAALETLEQSVHDDPGMTHKLLKMIDTNVGRLEALTADVLRLSQLESSGQPPDLSEIDVLPALESIGVLLDPLMSERRLRLEFAIDPELATIRTDPRLFELIFKNLIENAGKFAFEHTAIVVTARPGDAPETSVWRVTDRGVGIPIHHQPKVFDRFYQVDSARTGTQGRRGTGLGLAIVQNAVRALGGSIRVESIWQQGTTMIAELPTNRSVSSPSRPNLPEAASS